MTTTVYRSSSSDILKIWDDANSDVRDWHDQIDAFLDEHGLTGRSVFIDTAFGRPCGVGHNDSDVPHGWRVHRTHGYLVPRLTTKEGKLLSVRLGALTRPDPRDQVPGMPKNCIAEGAFMTCGMRPMGGALYVTWPRPIPEKQVDLTIWEKTKLSEYYAALEAIEAAEEVADRG
ncbi:hypothetical protein [Streptosporangium jomthongense]|uniref:Uncharacterized protein n=1 Tax=Streptosporangium jomthongense TaxID=1193683 RepID=A0ABV8F8A7_9ACTN